jgi:acetyltransferase-like isoleucine patch superfamily enzyme
LSGDKSGHFVLPNNPTNHTLSQQSTVDQPRDRLGTNFMMAMRDGLQWSTQALRVLFHSVSFWNRMLYHPVLSQESGNRHMMMKEKLKTILMGTGLLRVWNRWLGGNRIRMSGGHNQILIGKSLLIQTRIRIQGQNNTVSIGDGCRLRDLKIHVIGDSLRMEIADNCQIRGKIIVEDRGSTVAIGAGTTIVNALLTAHEGTHVRIGNDCMFSTLVGVRAGDTHSILDANTGQRLNPSQSINIGRHVWLCVGSTVMKGSQIGEGSIVGGFSIVMGSLPAGVLAVGTPAKVIRTNVSWQRERISPLVDSTPVDLGKPPHPNGS